MAFFLKKKEKITQIQKDFRIAIRPAHKLARWAAFTDQSKSILIIARPFDIDVSINEINPP
jgi:hypothetical protein